MRVIYIPDIAWSVYWQEGDTDMNTVSVLFIQLYES